MSFTSKVRTPVYRQLREGKIGGLILHSVAAFLYWTIYKRTPYIGTRIVEIPWVLNQLRSCTGVRKILQVGDVLLKKALKRYEVTVVDLDAEESSGPGLKVYKDDIRNVPLPPCYFDAAISISTLEHIGLQGPRFPDGDKLAVKIISRALKPGGWFFLTVPFGRSMVLNTYRIYDKDRLDFILRDQFIVSKRLFFVWDKYRWRRTLSEEAEKVGLIKNDPSRNLGVALVMARRI
jgi:SAM-dependent methyltransferase